MWGTTLLTGGTSASIWGYLIVAILTLSIGFSLAESKCELVFYSIQLINIRKKNPSL